MRNAIPGFPHHGRQVPSLCDEAELLGGSAGGSDACR